MNDDWRLRINLHDRGPARRLQELLATRELEHDLERTLGERVVVSVDGAEVFLYAGSRQQLERAAELVRRLDAEHSWDAELELAQWHREGERWEAPDAPAGADEHAERIDAERQESAQQGYPEFEVRVQCPDRRQAAELSKRLDGEGIPHLRRFSYLLIGATDEDSARALAARLRGELPGTCRLTVEPNPRAVLDDMPRSPFAVFGGLGG